MIIFANIITKVIVTLFYIFHYLNTFLQQDENSAANQVFLANRNKVIVGLSIFLTKAESPAQSQALTTDYYLKS
jgi:hypothetical protein